MTKYSFLRKLPFASLAFILTAGLSLPSTGLAASGDPSLTGLELDALRSELQAAPEPAYISPELNTSSSKQINVIVQLSSDPVAVKRFAARGLGAFSARSAESSITKEQTSFVELAKQQGIPLTVNYKYTTVLNGMEVTLPADKIPALAKLPGVKSVHENKTYFSIPVEEPPALTAEEATYDVLFDEAPLKQIGVPDAWAQGLTGEGIKVGVIDTGIDYNHPDLKDAYKGGYDSFYQDNDPYEEPPLTMSEDPYGSGFSGTSHGTHVAGTIAGQAKNTTSDIVQKGIAYNVDLYAYKVLGRNGSSARASGSSAQVIDGIERSVKDGMDVINLSLGSDQEKDPNSPDSIAINNAVLSGVVAVIANGNAADAQNGSYFYSMGSPASSQLGISVGAATTPGYTFTASASVTADAYSSVTDSTYHEFYMMGWRTSDEDFASIFGTGPHDLVYVDLGQIDDYDGLDVEGKVVLISRGNLAFVDKVTIAKQHGAKAAIIFNGNTSGSNPNEADLSENVTNRNDYTNVSLGDSLGFIPTFDMDGSDGRALARSILASGEQFASVSFNGEYPRYDVAGDTIASFSSRGPNSDELLGIKPDVSAPGVNIMSSYPAWSKYIGDASYEEAYERSSGTSMASPHVAGLAALLVQEHPDWTPFDVRAALANTSDALYDEKGTLYDVYSQGAGRVNIAKAIQTPALLQTVEQVSILDKDLNYQNVTNYGSSASFGVMAAGSAAKQIQLQLKNVSSGSVEYKASVVMHPDVTLNPYDKNSAPTPDVNNIKAELAGTHGGTVSAAAGGTQSFSLSVQPTAGAADGVYEGEIILESAGLPTLHLPFSVHVGDEQPATGFGLQEMTLSNTIITPNGDGKQDATDISFRLTADNTDYIELQIYGVDDKLVGVADAISTDTGFLEQGAYQFKNFNGTYVGLDVYGNLETDESGNLVYRHLTDGTYKITLLAPKLDENGNYKFYDGALDAYYASKALRVDNVPATPGNGGGGGGGSDDDDDDGGSGGGGSGGGGSTTPSPTPTPGQPAPVSAGSIQAVVQQGQTTQSVTASAMVSGNAQALTVTDADLQKALAAASQTPTAIVISANNQDTATTKLTLTAAQVEILSGAAANSSLILNSNGASLALPLSVLSSVSSGASLELIVSSEAQSAADFTKGLAGASVIGTPTAFEVNVLAGESSEPIAVPAEVRILRAFTVPGELEPNTAGVLYINNGKVHPAPSVFSIQPDGTAVVKVSRPGFSTYAAVSRASNFNDISSSYAQSEIQSLANKLLVNGTSDTAFSPKKNVTRAEFAAMLTRALGLQPTSSTPFSDVSSNNWYASDVGAAYQAGLINGRTNGTFDPSANISRQEMSVMLAKAVDLLKITADAEGAVRTPYADASSVAGYAQNSIEKVTAAGLMNGEASGGSSFFRPQAPTTREAAAKVLYLLLKEGELIN
ncbi:S8 family serine peptidase [Paenibacillus sp. P96]|uniref:S8 family serine peptidase n=1 Tax=Paenibacillus zeirhizosphaerae TaxID=2987519 RepID=A0ABT9FXB8_9BACL|nr:S8 family serine peptidase [Paenibacillus sp. P96]MDP4099279.1 S8 family serine peptidase [Paenibacillus sp. P96]